MPTYTYTPQEAFDMVLGLIKKLAETVTRNNREYTAAIKELQDRVSVLEAREKARSGREYRY